MILIKNCRHRFLVTPSTIPFGGSCQFTGLIFDDSGIGGYFVLTTVLFFCAVISV